MNKTKKEIVERGGLFIPLFFSFAATIENIPLLQFLKDPTKIVKSLKTIQGFYRFPGVICNCDPTVEAEALGCQLDWKVYPPAIHERPPIDAELKKRIEKVSSLGRIPIILDVAKRLSLMVRDSILLVTVTGPITIASLLSGRKISELSEDLLALSSKAVLNLVRSYGEVGLDIVLMVEEEFPELTDETTQKLRKLYSPIWNSVKFYEMHPVLMIKKMKPSELPSVASIADCLAMRDRSILADTLLTRSAYAIPVQSLTQTSEVFRTQLKNHLPPETIKSGKIFLVTTDQEIPPEFDKETLISGIRTVQDYIRECMES